MFDYRQRAMRVEVFKDTMARIEAENDLRQAVSRSIETQQFIAEGADIAPPGPPHAEPAAVSVTKHRSFEAARVHAGKGLRTAVLNFASSTSPGGGVTRGASAQEESLCRVSTLYPCLKDGRMWNLFYAPHRRAKNPLHNDSSPSPPPTARRRWSSALSAAAPSATTPPLSHGPTRTSSRHSGGSSARSSSPSSAAPGRRGTTRRSGESVENSPSAW